MYVDKQATAKWLINCAIRNIYAGECAVSNHVLVQAALGILQEYASAHKIKLTHNIIDYVKPEYKSRAAALLKERYNFFKHSDRDAGKETDITNLQVTNEIETFGNIVMFQQLFKTSSQHMNYFIAFFMTRAPGLWKLDDLPLPVEMKNKISALMSEFSQKPRRTLCEGMLELHKSEPSLVGELEEMQYISFSEETKFGEGYIDITKGTIFTRKKEERE